MFLLIRLAALIAGFLIRIRSRFRSRPQVVGKEAGRELLLRVEQGKYRIHRTWVGTPLRSEVVFRLSREGHLDRLFKSCGLATEMQTRDHHFDDSVYVLCDHPAFGELLRSSGKLREHVLALLNDGAQEVACDGESLWVALPGAAEAPEWGRRLATVAGELEALSRLPRAHDPFIRRAVLAESVLYALLGYGLGGVLELFFLQNPLYVWPMDMVHAGLRWALVGGGGGLALVLWLFKGSSRGHRLLLESVILILFVAPTVGITLVSELNRDFDTGVAVVLRPTVADTRSEERRTSKGGRRTYYYVSVVPGSLPGLPNDYEVSQRLFRQVTGRPGARLRLDLSPGYLGFPWFRRFSAERP